MGLGVSLILGFFMVRTEYLRMEHDFIFGVEFERLSVQGVGCLLSALRNRICLWLLRLRIFYVR